MTGYTWKLKTWKLTLEYDGTKYSGWQEQNNARTVGGQLRKAAEDFLDAEVEIQAAGRTDAGVHARAQVAHLRVRPKAASQRRFPPPDAILRAWTPASDRKSTRLNSSHQIISYAVFCL